ncbi:MAG: chorismate mutase [Bacteroidales bacterium]|nr:chorismate mutase [Bacteroidales bacterium]
MENNLEEIRREIDGVDARMAALFEQRMDLVRRVTEYKKAHGLGISDPSREEALVRRNAEMVADRAIREYYVNFEKQVIAQSRDWQRRLLSGMKIAYSGVPGAFAYIAARRLFPGAELVSFPDFARAYASCEAGETDVVVLPFENSFAGEVSTVTDLMFSGSLYVNQVVEVEAEQNLLGLPGADKSRITKVYSHPQALSQCAEYLQRHGFEAKEFANTALAAKRVAEKQDPTRAAIGTAEAAELYGLEILEARINTSRTNTTRFAAFSRVLNLDTENKRKMGKHFILMYTVKNEAGALAQTLNIIGTHNYNMYNLHSRPMKELLWNYYFFVELDGDIATEEGSSMLRELAPLCDRLKLVGSFYTR